MKTVAAILSLFLSGMMTRVCAQVPNGGFESWTSGNPDGWFVTNIVGGYITTTQTSDAYSGSSAAHGEVISFFSSLQQPLFQSGTDAKGFPVAVAFPAVELYYKFSPLSGDRLAVNITAQKSGIVIGTGAVALSAAAGSYTHLSVPISYSTSDIPDTAIIQISIVGPSGSDYHLGSAMWIDDVSLTSATGITQAPGTDPEFSFFPNPANDVANVRFDADQSGELEVLDVTGQLVYRIPFAPDGQSASAAIPTSTLPAGIYITRVNTGSATHTGRFSVYH